MREKFKQQLEKNKTVTEESLLEMENKTYHNGDEVKVGDKILFAMTMELVDEDGNPDSIYLTPMPGWPEDEVKTKTMNLRMIMLNENQLDLYEFDRVQGGDYLPVIKLK